MILACVDTRPLGSQGSTIELELFKQHWIVLSNSSQTDRLAHDHCNLGFSVVSLLQDEGSLKSPTFPRRKHASPSIYKCCLAGSSRFRSIAAPTACTGLESWRPLPESLQNFESLPQWTNTYPHGVWKCTIRCSGETYQRYQPPADL